MKAAFGSVQDFSEIVLFWGWLECGGAGRLHHSRSPQRIGGMQCAVLWAFCWGAAQLEIEREILNFHRKNFLKRLRRHSHYKESSPNWLDSLISATLRKIYLSTGKIFRCGWISRHLLLQSFIKIGGLLLDWLIIAPSMHNSNMFFYLHNMVPHCYQKLINDTYSHKIGFPPCSCAAGRIFVSVLMHW